MPVSVLNLGAIIRAGLELTPEEIDRMRVTAAAEFAVKAAKERAKYDALTPTEKAEYDALTEGMMPRLRRP